ncbi:MAG TPA: SCO family protein [Caldimonas sp.]|nr:SCO family protein [Caldimonas sp.]
MTTRATILRRTGRSALAVAALCAASCAFAASPAAVPAQPATVAAALPGNSIYQLAVPLTDQNGRTSQLDERRGHPMLVAMFYTSCKFVCPMLIEALRETEAKLGPEDRKELSILMVSIDPAHDTVAVLRQTADERHLDGAHWTLARTDATHLRKLAAVLGVQYRALANGDFNHTSSLILVDSEGRIAGRTNRLGDADPAFVRLVKGSLTTH